jgi:hypothetical protein
MSQNVRPFGLQDDSFSNVRAHNPESSEQLLDQSKDEDLLFEGTFWSQSDLTLLNSPKLLSPQEAFLELDTQSIADDFLNNMVDLEIDNMSPVPNSTVREYEQSSTEQKAIFQLLNSTEPQALPLKNGTASPRTSIILPSPRSRRPEKAAISTSAALLPMTDSIGNDIMSRLEEYSGTFFFHPTDMLQEKQPESREEVYDLFGRVVYTQRENFHHRQYFRLRDAFRDKPPLLNGVLSG